MKKSLLAMTALAAMLFAGCTSSDEITTLESIKQAENAPAPISFGTYMGRTQTRSGVSGDINADANAATLAAKNGFGVFAYYTGASTWDGTQGSTKPNFMYNEHVTSADNGLTWIYSPYKFWPNQYGNGNVDNKEGNNEGNNAQSASELGKVSFFAYGPYVAVADPTNGNASSSAYGITALSTNAATTHPTISYKLAKGQENSEGEDFVDLLWGLKATSPETYNVDLTKNSVGLTEATKDGKVKFIFKHALTKVGGDGAIKVCLDIDGKGSGGDTGSGSKQAQTLVTVNDILIENVAGEVVTEGTFDLSTGTWSASKDGTSGLGTQVNLRFTPSGTGTDIKLNEAISEGSIPNWVTDHWNQDGVLVSSTNIYDSSVGTAAKKPVYLIPSSSVAQQFKVTIQYTVRTYDNKLAAPASGETTCSKVTQTISNIVTLPTTLLKPNKKITLVLHLGLTSVKFAAQVHDWDTPSASDIREVWLPSNVVTVP